MIDAEDVARSARYAETLNKIRRDLVTWDRCVFDPHGITVVYGWIPRDDDRSDFVSVVFWNDEEGEIVEWFFTSSAKHSRELDVNMRGTDEGHTDCQRVEDVFGSLVARKATLE